MSHPLKAQEGVRTETTAPGLSVHIRETWDRITWGSNGTHPKESAWRNTPHPIFFFFALRVHTRAQTQTGTGSNDGNITGPEIGPCGSMHLPETDVKNKSERSSDRGKTHMAGTPPIHHAAQ